MFGIVSLGWWLMRSPLVWLWYAYRGLWWAFADAPAPVPQTSGGQDTAFQVMDSRRPSVNLPRPDGLLRIGFAASAALSVVIAAVLMVVNGHGSLAGQHAMMVWVWLSLLVVVLSQFWVRYVALARHANRSAWTSARDSIGKAARTGGSAAIGATVGAAGAVGRTLKNLGGAAKRYHAQRTARAAGPANTQADAPVNTPAK